MDEHAASFRLDRRAAASPFIKVLDVRDINHPPWWFAIDHSDRGVGDDKPGIENMIRDVEDALD